MNLILGHKSHVHFVTTPEEINNDSAIYFFSICVPFKNTEERTDVNEQFQVKI